MRNDRAILFTRRSALALVAGSLPAGTSRAADAPREIVIVTSFPASVYEPFRVAFERTEPAHRLRILNRKTTAALAMLAEGRSGEADLFWASAPDAFAVLKDKNLLAPLAESAVAPGMRVRGYPVDDPDGLFRGFSISGYGLCWNRARLREAGLLPPASVSQLTDPVYRGLIAMSAPSRSGTTHLMVETILQRYGWENGWRIWLRIAANLANVAARSFSVVSGVAQGRYAIGLSIDFLGRGQGSGSEIGFGYPAENVFLPASIALLRAGRNSEGARRFARFVLSEAGQKLLLHPGIRRQPVMPRLAGEMPNPVLPDLSTQDERPKFDAALSGRRYELVNLIFDELVTERLAAIHRFRHAVSALSARVAEGSAEAEELTAIVRLVDQPPEAVVRLAQVDGLPHLRRVPRGAPVPPDQARLAGMIRSAAEEQLQEADTRLDQLANRIQNNGAMPRRSP